MAGRRRGVAGDTFPVDAIVSDLDTDPWTVHAKSAEKEPDQ